MAGRLPQHIIGRAVELYCSGKSIPDVSDLTGIPRSTVHYHLAKTGALRSRGDGVRAAQEKLGSGWRGKTRQFSQRHRQAIRESALVRGEATAKGVSHKASGYVEITRGEHKGRSVHVIAMERRLGRPLRDDEIVHHIDGDRSNNQDDNLALMTRAGHARHHRREQKLAKGK